MSYSALEVTEIDGRSSYSRENGKITASRVFHVFFDPEGAASFLDIEKAAAASDGSTSIPRVGSTWPGGGLAYVKSITPTPLNVVRGFEVTVTYESPTGANQTTEAAQAGEDPLSRPATIRWSGGPAEMSPYFEDAQSTPARAVNTAGDSLDPQPTRLTANSMQVTITSNQSANRAETLWGLRHVLNSSGVTIGGITFAIDTVMLDSFEVSELVTETIDDGLGGEVVVPYYVETLVFIFRPADTWRDQFESRGIVNASNETKDVADGLTTADLDIFWPLDESGEFTANRSDTPATVTLYPYHNADLSNILPA